MWLCHGCGATGAPGLRGTGNPSPGASILSRPMAGSICPQLGHSKARHSRPSEARRQGSMWAGSGGNSWFNFLNWYNGTKLVQILLYQRGAKRALQVQTNGLGCVFTAYPVCTKACWRKSSPIFPQHHSRSLLGALYHPTMLKRRYQLAIYQLSDSAVGIGCLDVVACG